MSVKPLKPTMHALFWGCTLILFVLTVLLFKSVLLPFVLGIAVAYLLNPIVNKLGRLGMPRMVATILILGCFFIFIIGFIAVISPIVYRELAQFTKDLPTYIEKISELARPLTERVEHYIGSAQTNNIEGILTQHSGSAIGAANYIMQKAAAGGQALMDIISVAVFMPIVAYFMMVEWPNIMRWIRDLMPRHSEDVITDLLQQIDRKLSGFVRGQITVAVALGIAYAVALSLAGLKYGFLIGMMSGLLSVIPMVGSFVGLVVSVAVAWFQFGDITFVGIIAAIFIIGQVLEGNVLTPKLVGNSVGLHPLWVFFALLAGGGLLGILGMFLAVPFAAVVGVLLAFAITKYKQSPYYREATVDVPKLKAKPKSQLKPKPKSKPKAKAQPKTAAAKTVKKKGKPNA